MKLGLPFSYLCCFLPSFPALGSFQQADSSHQVVKLLGCFSFSISPSSEYSGLISFRMDWFYLLAVQGTLKSSPAPQFESIKNLSLRLLYGPTVTSKYPVTMVHNQLIEECVSTLQGSIVSSMLNPFASSKLWQHRNH